MLTDASFVNDPDGFHSFSGFHTPEGRPINIEVIGILQDAVHDGVSPGVVAQDFSPGLGRDLTDDDDRLSQVSVIDQICESDRFTDIKLVQAPVIDDQQITFRQGFAEASERYCQPWRHNEFEQYNLIILGFPIWYYSAPNVVNTFCKGYDWTGKNIGVFATSGGSEIGKTIEKLQPYVKGLSLLGEKVVKNEEELAEWIDCLR